MVQKGREVHQSVGEGGCGGGRHRTRNDGLVVCDPVKVNYIGMNVKQVTLYSMNNAKVKGPDEARRKRETRSMSRGWNRRRIIIANVISGAVMVMIGDVE